MRNKAVFLDRDGVINDMQKHVNKPDDLILFPWATASIRRLKEAGFMVFVVTNQGGIEMGYFTEEDLNQIHARLEVLLKEDDTYVDDIEFCPHFNEECECRKPKPGMILSLAKRHDVDLDSSWMVGDRNTDILAGNEAGCKTIKLGDIFRKADYTCDNLKEAVDYILNN